MANVVIGVDPGLSGGLAVLDLAGDVVDVRVMPVLKSGGKGEVDIPGLAGYIRGLQGTHAVRLAAIESVASMPGQGVVSVFTFGVGYGVVRGVLGTLGVPVELVRPQEWMRHVLGVSPTPKRKKGEPPAPKKAKDKTRGLVYCARRFPGLSLKMTPRATTGHNGVADAVAIAEYARRLVLGTKGSSEFIAAVSKP